MVYEYSLRECHRVPNAKKFVYTGEIFRSQADLMSGLASNANRRTQGTQHACSDYLQPARVIRRGHPRRHFYAPDTYSQEHTPQLGNTQTPVKACAISILGHVSNMVAQRTNEDIGSTCRIKVYFTTQLK